MLMLWQTVGLMLLSALAAAGATALYFRLRTARRVRQVLFVKQMAMGDLEKGLQTLDLEGNDEDADDLGQLRLSINQLANELRAIIQRISSERNTMAILLQNLTDGIISVDDDGFVSEINDAARHLLSLSPGFQPSNATFMQVVRDYEMNKMVQQTLSDGQQRSQLLEVGLRRPQLQVKVTPIEAGWIAPSEDEPHKHLRSVLVVLQDLTELNRLERVRRDFVANISHELRTPLASIKLMIETLQDVLEDDPQAAHDFLNRIDTEIDSLTELVRELLELSRIELGQIKLQLRATDIRELVEQAAERLRAQAARHGLELTPLNGSRDSLPLALAEP